MTPQQAIIEYLKERGCQDTTTVDFNMPYLSKVVMKDGKGAILNFIVGYSLVFCNDVAGIRYAIDLTNPTSIDLLDQILKA